MTLSDKAVSRLLALAATVATLALVFTLTRILVDRGMTIATGIQLALLVVVLFQMVDLPRRHRRWLADLEKVKGEMDAANSKGDKILAQLELTAPERAELEAWRHVGELRGIHLTVEWIREPKLH